MWRAIAQGDVEDLDALERLAVLVCRNLRDLLHHSHSLDDAGEYRVLPVEGRLLGDDYEKLRSGAVRPARDLHGRNRPSRMLLVVELSREQAQPAGSVVLPSVGIFRLGIAALDDAVLDHAVERRVVVGVLFDHLDEITDVVRRFLRQEIEYDLTHRGLEVCVFLHLLESLGRLEKALRGGERTDDYELHGPSRNGII